MLTTIVSHPLFMPMLVTLVVIALFPLVAGYIVLVERKLLADFQVRPGPMHVGPHGLLQPIADALKLLLKEDIIPTDADQGLFWSAPLISTCPALTSFAVLPFSQYIYVADVNVGILVIMAMSAVGIYGIILGGWASNSHYPLLGALRSSAQLVSYEVAAGIAVVSVVLLSHSLSMVEIVKHQQGTGWWNVFVQPVAFFVYLVAAIAETNRSPFDLPEAESELTAGFHTEYSGFRFSLFFMAEYTAMVLVSSIGVTLFFGGWLRPFAGVHALDFLDYAPVASLLGFAVFIGWLARPTPVTGERRFWMALAAGLVLLAVPVVPVLDKVQGIFWFSAKVIVFLYAFIWYRGTFPRYRYDQLMNLGWRWMIPLALANLIGTAVVDYLVHPQATAAWMVRR